jgi:hypothetical protein
LSFLVDTPCGIVGATAIARAVIVLVKWRGHQKALTPVDARNPPVGNKQLRISIGYENCVVITGAKLALGLEEC